MFINFRVSFNVFCETAHPFRQIPNFPNQEPPQMEEESRKEAEEPRCRSFHHFWRGFQMVPRTSVFILVASNLVVDGRWYYTLPLQYHYHTIGISMSFIRHTQPGPDFLEIQPGVLWPNLTGDEDVGWNHPFLMGFCMKSTIQLLGVPPWRAGNRKPPNLFWRDSSHCFTTSPSVFWSSRDVSS
jgi:hypothetical protein